MYVGRHVYASACACMWSQNTRWGAISSVCHCLIIETGSPFTLSLLMRFRLACQQASGIYLSLPRALGLQVHATMLSYLCGLWEPKSDPYSS